MLQSISSYGSLAFPCFLPSASLSEYVSNAAVSCLDTNLPFALRLTWAEQVGVLPAQRRSYRKQTR
ncbi:hypothetical protein X975_11190, partial [Stegodyphus mimosarum]